MPEIDFSIPSQYYHHSIAISIALGAIWCFFGYKIFRFVLGILGFIVGAVVAGAIGYELSEGREIIAIASAIVGGLLGAGIMFMLYIFGVFLIGVILGALIVLLVSSYFNPGPDDRINYTIMIIVSIACGVVAVIFKRFMIILATSLTGAWVVVTGLAYFVENNFDPFRPDTILELTENEVYRILIIWFALSVAGFTLQYINCVKDYKPELESDSDEAESDTEDKEIIELDEPYDEPNINSIKDPSSDREDTSKE